jgi:hypothetical protein
VGASREPGAVETRAEAAVGNRECGALSATLSGSRAGSGSFIARDRSVVWGSAS